MVFDAGVVEINVIVSGMIAIIGVVAIGGVLAAVVVVGIISLLSLMLLLVLLSLSSLLLPLSFVVIGVLNVVIVVILPNLWSSRPFDRTRSPTNSYNDVILTFAAFLASTEYYNFGSKDLEMLLRLFIFELLAL